jgi:hypothetical protein
MVYRGQVCGEVIVLAPGVRLPEGMEVLIEPIGSRRAESPITEFPLRNGVPVFPRNGSSPAPSLGIVNQLRDDAP